MVMMTVRVGRSIASACTRSGSLLDFVCGVSPPSCANASATDLPARVDSTTTTTSRQIATPARHGHRARVAVTLVALLAAGCMTRLTNDERVKIEFWGTVSAEAETAVRELSDEGRGELVQALPEAERERTWQGVLDVLDDRPALEPLADRIRAVVEAETDAGVRLELATPSGNAHLRELILTSIENGLSTP